MAGRPYHRGSPGLAHIPTATDAGPLALIRKVSVGTMVMDQCQETAREAPHRAPEGEGLSEVRWAPLGALTALLLIQPIAYAQDGLGLDALDAPSFERDAVSEMRARVAAEFPDALLTRFRNIRRITTEAGHEVEFCGQVGALHLGQLVPNFQVFLYYRTGTTETVHILGTDALNGFRTGRKMIGALRRAGCM